MRHDPRLVELASYPHVRVLDTMFSDMDIQQHVNNVAIARLFEEARSSLHRAMTDGHPDSFTSVVLARLEVHYLREVTYPSRVEIGVGTSAAGTSSWGTVAGLFQDGLCAALAWSTQVRRSDEQSSSVALTAAERAAVDRFVVAAD
jgi:acyl-CoA thioester hydrolase